MNKLWGYWLNEPIYLDKGITNIVKRKEAIRIFCIDGLIPFLKRAGYVFYYNDNEVVKQTCRLLFTFYIGKKVKALPIQYENMKEHFDEYECRLGQGDWENFWATWGSIQDFEQDRYGFEMRYILPAILWSWIYFEHSPAIQQLERELQQLEEEDFSKGKDDPYLVETSKRDYHDRHW